MASPGKAEAGRDGGGAEGAAAGRGSGGKLKVDVFLGFCRIVNTVTAISAILCFVGFCMAIVAALHTDGFSVRVREWAGGGEGGCRRQGRGGNGGVGIVPPCRTALSPRG